MSDSTPNQTSSTKRLRTDDETVQMDVNSRRIDQLQEQMDDLEKQLNGVKEVQIKQQRVMHGLEKVTRGHNLHVFGLDKNYLFQHKLIENEEWVSVFKLLCTRGLGIEQQEVDKIVQHIDIIHELATGGFIICFNRRSDKSLIVNKKRNLGSWAPCKSLSNKFKYVSIQVDLPVQEQGEKILRNQMCKAYKEAGLKVKYVGWNKMAIGEGEAKLFTSFPRDPLAFKKEFPALAKKASMNSR